jgi:hypothetical protein
MIIGLIHSVQAFFGNTLHESDDFKASRELSMCQTQTIGSDGKLYCKPSGYASGDYNDPYCSAAHTPASDPDGCTCGPIAESTVAPGYLDAEKLFFGRGAIQLSWNYNYIDAGAALDADFCANPELVATDGEYGMLIYLPFLQLIINRRLNAFLVLNPSAWGTALWFWATNTGSAGTCRTAVLTNGDFGSTLNIINSMECPVDSGHGSSVAQRLNYYCKAATTLGVDALLALDGCPLMASTFNTCAVAGGDCANW